MPEAYDLVIHGKPATKGSTFAFRSHSTGRVITKADCRHLDAWSRAVAAVAAIAHVPKMAKGIGVKISAVFELTRPKRCPRSLPVVRPDLDKLERALLDALIGVAFEDDGQVVDIHAWKEYTDAPTSLTRVTITRVESPAW